MPIVIGPAEDIPTSKYARWTLYGQNGVGKTTFAASIPENLLTLVVSADDENTAPLKGMPHITVAKIDAWEDVAEILGMLQNPSGTPLFKSMMQRTALNPKALALAKARMADPDVRSGKIPFWHVVVFDTWSRMQALAANMIVGYKLLAPGDEAKLIKSAPKLPRGYEAWQQIGALAGEWMRYFQRQPIHVIFLMQEARRDSKYEDEPAMIGPALTPTALVHAKDTCTLVGRMYVKTVPKKGEHKGDDLEGGDALGLDNLEDTTNALTIREDVQEIRKLLVGKHDQYFTKGPTHKLGYVVSEPSWTKLAAMFE